MKDFLKKIKTYSGTSLMGSVIPARLCLALGLDTSKGCFKSLMVMLYLFL